MTEYTVRDFAFKADMSAGVVAICHHCGRQRWAAYPEERGTYRLKNHETGGVAKRTAWLGVVHTDGCALVRAAEQSVRK